MTNENLVTHVKKKKSTYLIRSGVYNFLLGKELLCKKMETTNNNFMLLRTKNKIIIDPLDKAIGNTYTHHNIQTLLLKIVSRYILMRKLKTIRKNVFFFNNGT